MCLDLIPEPWRDQEQEKQERNAQLQSKSFPLAEKIKQLLGENWLHESHKQCNKAIWPDLQNTTCNNARKVLVAYG